MKPNLPLIRTGLIVICVSFFIAIGTHSNAEEFFPASAPEKQGLSSESIEKLSAAVDHYLDENTIVGAELLVIKNGYNVFQKTYGFDDRETEIEMHPNMIYNIRSMTKSITGTAIQILIEQGKIKPEDKASKYIPGFDNEQTRGITIEQLLTHHSGLPLTIMTDTSYKTKYENLLQLANETGENGTQFEPGKKFWYSDAGCEVLGAIIEVVTGDDLDEFVEENIFEPLGMENSFYCNMRDCHDRERIANLYFGSGGKWNKFWDPEKEESLYPFALGSQSAFTTTKDYCKFLKMLMNGGEFKGSRILSEKSVQRMLTPRTVMKMLGSDAEYPCGFSNLRIKYGHLIFTYVPKDNENTGKPLIIGHGGSDGTMAWAWPEEDLLVMYFTQSRGGTSVLDFERQIAIHIFGQKEEQSAEAASKYAEFTGKYVLTEGAIGEKEFKALIQNGNLAVDIPGQMVFELNEPDESGIRTFKIAPQVGISFDKNEGKEVAAMNIHEDAVFPLKEKKGCENEKFKPYTGIYTHPLGVAALEVIVRNDSLAILPPDGKIAMFGDPDENGRRKKVTEPWKSLSFGIGDDGKIDKMTVHVVTTLKKGASLGLLMEEMIGKSGTAEALEAFEQYKADKDYLWNEKSLNSLGYRLVNKKNYEAALEVFSLNTRLFPGSFNVWDSLGEAYMNKGEKELAIKNYKKSLEINPANKNAEKMLKKLRE